MKRILFTITSFIIAVTLLAVTAHNGQTPISRIVKKENGSGFAVIELFTSQGCSSCPRADEVLGNYAQANDSHIIPIAFHVDYWNQLGWRDSFSNHQYTMRQEKYDNDFLHASVYTPQAIINGEKELVGSDKVNIKHAVDNALNETPQTIIDIKSATITNRKETINYTITGNIANSTLNAVLVQYKTVTKIKAGENNGATLVNYNVARQLISITAKESGSCQLQLPVGVDVKELSLVLFTQDNTSGKITGAIKK